MKKKILLIFLMLCSLSFSFPSGSIEFENTYENYSTKDIFFKRALKLKHDHNLKLKIEDKNLFAELKLGTTGGPRRIRDEGTLSNLWNYKYKFGKLNTGYLKLGVLDTGYIKVGYDNNKLSTSFKYDLVEKVVDLDLAKKGFVLDGGYKYNKGNLTINPKFEFSSYKLVEYDRYNTVGYNTDEYKIAFEKDLEYKVSEKLKIGSNLSVYHSKNEYLEDYILENFFNKVLPTRLNYIDFHYNDGQQTNYKTNYIGEKAFSEYKVNDDIKVIGSIYASYKKGVADNTKYYTQLSPEHGLLYAEENKKIKELEGELKIEYTPNKLKGLKADILLNYYGAKLNAGEIKKYPDGNDSQEESYKFKILGIDSNLLYDIKFFDKYTLTPALNVKYKHLIIDEYYHNPTYKKGEYGMLAITPDLKLLYKLDKFNLVMNVETPVIINLNISKDLLSGIGLKGSLTVGYKW